MKWPDHGQIVSAQHDTGSYSRAAVEPRVKHLLADLLASGKCTQDNIQKVMGVHGYFRICDHQIWGACPTYKNYVNGSLMFLQHETENADNEDGYRLVPVLYTATEMYHNLQETWRPVGQREQSYMIAEMRSDFERLGAAVK